MNNKTGAFKKNVFDFGSLFKENKGGMIKHGL